MAIRLSQQFSVLFGVGIFAVLVLFARPIAEVFSGEPAVVEVIILYLTIVGSSYDLQGVLQLSTTALNVLNKPFEAASLSLLRMVGLYIPLALLGRYLFGLQGVFAAAAVASGISGILAFIRLRQVTAESNVPVTPSASVSASSPAP